MPLKTIVSGANPLATDVGQLVESLNGTADVGPLQFVAPQTTPGAPTGTDSGSAGNLNGLYRWVTVLMTGWQQSDGSYYVTGFVPSTDSAQVSVSSHYANLTNIATGGAGVIGRAIYRTVASGGAGTEKFSFVMWGNTATTATDNIADGSLGTGMPGSGSNPAAYGTAIPVAVPTSNTTGTQLLDCTFLSLVQKCYNNISITYHYTGSVLSSITITGQITATITYTYSGAVITQEQIVIAVPFSRTITTTYTYSSGVLTGESRVIS
jgi:hypothetical protein